MVSFGLFGLGPIMWGAIILCCWPCMIVFIMLGCLAATFCKEGNTFRTCFLVFNPALGELSTLRYQNQSGTK